MFENSGFYILYGQPNWIIRVNRAQECLKKNKLVGIRQMHWLEQDGLKCVGVLMQEIAVRPRMKKLNVVGFS